MSFAGSVSTPSQATRRFHARRKIDGLSYVEFGQDNGAILIDLGEGGLGFQSVLPVSMNQALLFKFKFPGESNYVEGLAEVAWMNESGKGGGLRFMEVSADACAKIREWAGLSPAPEASPVHRGNGARAAQENANENSQARSKEPSAAPEGSSLPEVLAAPETSVPEVLTAPETSVPEALEDAGGPAEISEKLSTLSTTSATENAQPPSPLPPNNLKENDAQAAEDVEEDQKQELAAEARPTAPPIPEFTIEVTAADFSETLPRQRESWSPAAPGFVANPLISESKSTLTHHAQQIVEKSGNLADEPVNQPDAKEPVRRGSDVRGAEMAKATMRAAQKPRKPMASKPEWKPEPATPTAYRQEPGIGMPYTRKVPKPISPSAEWENLEVEADVVTSEATLASQALRIGTGAAAGACLVLALFMAVPSLRTRVEATAGSRAGALNLVSAPAFQVEIADLNNRRWILRSGGDAASPFNETPSRREAAGGSIASSRGDSAKSSRSGESDDSSSIAAPKQPKLPKPSELALARPHTTQTGTVSEQLTAPSIFDGITPPIGSVSAPLVTGGPEAPGIVPPEVQAPRTAALQSAVLVQRVAPVYPANALEARVQGDVRANATIGKDGIPKDLKVITGDLRLVPAALAAIRQWRYRPATLAGEAIETQIVITVSFQLK